MKDRRVDNKQQRKKEELGNFNKILRINYYPKKLVQKIGNNMELFRKKHSEIINYNNCRFIQTIHIRPSQNIQHL